MEEVSKRKNLLKKWQALLFNISKKNPLLYPQNNQVCDIKHFIADWSTNQTLQLVEQLSNHSAFSLHVISKEDGNQLNELFSAANKHRKEKGHKSLTLSLLCLNWQIDLEVTQSPLYLLPVELKKNPSFLLQADATKAILNPVVDSLLRHHHNIQLPESIELSIETFEKNIQTISAQLLPEGFSVHNHTIYLSLFDYPNKSLVEDYNKLLAKGEINTLIHHLFEAKATYNLAQEIVSDALIDELPVALFDTDQEQAILRAMQGYNLLLSGPPGTGKSQTITNIISSALAKNKRILLVSAKRAALESVYGKMKTIDLHNFCALIHHVEKDKASFIEDLKSLLETKRKGVLNLHRIEAERKTILQRYRHVLQAIDKTQQFLNSIVPGASQFTIKHLIDKLLQIGKHSKEVSQDVPSINLYENYHAVFLKIYDLFMLNLGLAKLGNHPLHFLKRVSWTQYSDAKALISAIEREHAWRDKLIILLHEMGLEQDLKTIEKLLQFSFEIQPYLLFAQHSLHSFLAEDSLDYQNFIRDLHAFELQQKELQKIKQLNTHWKHKIPLKDAQDLLDKIKITERQSFRILDKDYRKNLLKVWQLSHLRFYERPSVQGMLNQLIKEYLLEESTNSLEKDLSNRSNGLAFNQLKDLAQAWHEQLDPSLKTLFLNLIVSQDQINNLSALCSLAQVIHEGNLLLQTDDLELGLHQLKQVQEDLGTIEKSFEYFNSVASDEKAFHFVWTIDATYELRVKQCLLNTWQEITKQHPWIIQESGPKYKASVEALFKAKEEVLRLNALLLEAKYDESYQKILRTAQLSKSRLKAKEKETLDALRTGLKVLEKETSKHRAFQSFRAWQEGPGQEFINHIKPVWMMSPDSIADALPLEKESFDLVIFDEASQLSLAACIPVLYRAKQCIVVGDERQLPPTQFFEKTIQSSKENEDEGLLTAAKKSFPIIHLNWHYRSEDEALIRFNNEVFYAGKLKTIPSRSIANSIGPALLVKNTNQAAFNYKRVRDYALALHYMNHSQYVNGVNEAEAHYVAALTKHFLLSQQPLNIGILCLSNSQQACIQSALNDLKFFDKNYGQLLEEKYASDENFDGIFLRNLENIQGEERDIILISLGYGPNENGHVHLNFGPINQDGGDRRLNVLFSRAKKHMVVVSSIQSKDILSDNPGSMCLKNYLAFLENTPNDHTYSNSDLHSSSPKPWIQDIGQFISKKGYDVTYNYGYSSIQFALVVRSKEDDEQYILGLLCDDDEDQSIKSTSQLVKTEILRAFGWNVLMLRSIDYLSDKESLLNLIAKTLEEIEQNNQVEVPKGKRNDFLDELKYDESKLLFTRLEIKQNEHLFWELAGNLNDIVIRYGKVGSKGRKLIKSYESVAQVIKEKRKLIRQKEKQGYRRV